MGFFSLLFITFFYNFRASIIYKGNGIYTKITVIFLELIKIIFVILEVLGSI